MDEKYNELHERITAGRLLTLIAHKASEQLDSMSGWMLIGFGGAYALVFANYASLQHLVSAHSLHASLLLLLAAFVLASFSVGWRQQSQPAQSQPKKPK